ncbi:MAG TPA: hypothetical protein VD997_04385 [Phycisphaerales bacterium]|nr:hypothetical protein [Phycisphaerales bacterium]
MDPLPITIILTLAACAGALMLRPGAALGMIIASMFLWPEYLRVPVGIAQMSVPRMAALVLYLRLVLSPGDNPPRFRWADAMVILFYLWMVAANLIAGTPVDKFKTVVGSGFDTVLMYLMARKVFAEPGAVKGIVKGLAVCVLIMAPLGVLENVLRFSPYIPFLYREGIRMDGGGSEIRLGMRRAFASTEQPIFFGMGMLLVTGLLFSFRRVFEARWTYLAVLGAGVLAILTSLSSGPWSGLFVLVCLNALFWMPQLIKPGLIATTLLLVAVEVLSNRHFYHLIDYLALDKGNAGAYYRSRLMEVAVKYLPNYWAVGYGGKTLDNWGPDIDGRTIVDMVNNYVLLAASGGVLAALLYIGVKIAALVTLIKCYRQGEPAVKAVAFGLASVLIALSFSELSVGLFGPPLLLSFITLGMSISCAEWLELRARTRQMRAPARRLAVEPLEGVPATAEAAP